MQVSTIRVEVSDRYPGYSKWENLRKMLLRPRPPPILMQKYVARQRASFNICLLAVGDELLFGKAARNLQSSVDWKLWGYTGMIA